MSEDESVGRVAELWRFPVKSFQGEPMGQAVFTDVGMVGDRQYALRDTATGKILSAKRHGVLLEAAARWEGGDVVITMPGGQELAAEEPGVDKAMSDWLGFPVHLDRAAAGSSGDGTANGVYEFAFDVDDSPDAEWFDIPILDSAFVDLARAHLLTTASLAEGRRGHPGGDWDTRRFRPTALVDTGDAEGFVEDGWVGGRVRLGGLTLQVDLPTIRCVMPTRPQPVLAGRPPLRRDKAVSRFIADENGHNLGVYCSIVSPGPVAVGDAVSRIPTAG